MISLWLRVIRVKFLLASVIAVTVGLSLHWWQTQDIDILHAFLTYGGVVFLHASVDLLNDYWDFKRGIDTKTQRTKFSGGTGVLPEGLLNPSLVYKAGLLFMFLGSAVGLYFVIISGAIIAALLAFAVVSIYFYSTKIVDSGLAEIFVTIKGTVIVLGTYFIQSNMLTLEAALAGLIVGVLSSLVLFITSFPDYEADKSVGRKTLVIVLGKKISSYVYWVFPILTYLLIMLGIVSGSFPILSIITFATLPLIMLSGSKLKSGYNYVEKLIPIMKNTLSYSRITGLLLAASFLLDFFISYVKA